jgi:uncharacterized protein
MILDCHTHIGRNEHINATVDQLLRSMDTAEIDKSLVFAGKLNSVSNEYLAEQIAPHKDRLYGVACFHPNDSLSALDKLLAENSQIVAVKFYLGYDHWYPWDNHICSALIRCQLKNIPAIFHCGDCLNSVRSAKLKYAHPLGIDDVAVDHPNTKFVIAHMGFPWHRDAAEVCYKNKNVYADISGFVYGKFNDESQKKFDKVVEEFVELAPSSKLLFGSDWPISDQESYRYVAGANKHIAFSEKQSSIAMKLFNIE